MRPRLLLVHHAGNRLQRQRRGRGRGRERQRKQAGHCTSSCPVLPHPCEQEPTPQARGPGGSCSVPPRQSPQVMNQQIGVSCKSPQEQGRWGIAFSHLLTHFQDSCLTQTLPTLPRPSLSP